ncbi:HEPN domain-containing protein [Patescibacteria group bacterium]|nr:HEPN domain-containing protein [Patescibacteria group bacterium]MBU1663274.1 HEPN domain-containing protein [Patescibacteria group bacterium]MBU1933868.1 HEPN domain-containing protein [Patescibacteria group bacterium]MBU2007988.1 HEPN domain-containing protein [Patescibacteria group bacterium]MBU2233567.1 HEPN domain-containing protein [Patescibacteria group bacterium]
MKKILENLINDGLLQKESGIKFDQISRRLKRALIDLNNSKLLLKTDSMGAYTMSYDAMLQAGIALILSLGYRPKVINFHKTVTAAVGEILDKNYSPIVKKFDQMRKSRHHAVYDAVIISLSEAEVAIKTAQEFIKRVNYYMDEKSSQKKLL